MRTGTRLLRGSVSLFAMMSVAGLAHAQDATQTAQTAPTTTGTASAPVEQIEVTGIRASLQKSMDIKRKADGVTDAVSATDIGQLPDKNIADALQRVPGINTIQSASAGSGGFGENDRVQIRGTAPTLTQTLIDGHAISSGDWFILDSLSAASRSVSYDLLPVDIVDHVEVVKSPQADLPEGATAGNVNIRTPDPLSSEFNQITALVRAGASYNDLADRAGGQYNAVLGWKNDANTFGFYFVGFHDTRYFRRDGQEELGYSQLPSGATVAGPHGTTIANPYPTALRGVYYPEIINNALFEQEQLRQGGDAAVEFKPNNHWDFKLDGFYSYLNAGNYNQGDLVDLNDYNGGFGSSAGTYVVPSSYTVKNGILTSATFPGTTGHANPGINDIYRPGAGSSTYFLDGNTTWTPTENWKVHVQGGYSRGKGQTDQYAYGTTSAATPNVNYALNGTNPATLGFSGATAALNDPSNYAAFNGDGNQDWVGDTHLAQLDTDASGQVDVEYMLDSGLISSIKGGVRITEHERNEVESENYGCYSAVCGPTLAGIANGLFPSNFAGGLGIGVPFNLSVDPNGLAALMQQLVNTTGQTVARRYYPQAAFKIKENTEAGYLMAKFGNDTFHGNFGVRVASTTDDINKFDSNPASPSVLPSLGSDFGAYYINHVQQNYTDILPSFSVAYDATKDVVVHFSAGETVTRPDYYALAGGATLNDTLLSGSQGNPNLKPTRSTNLDLSTEWYYAPQSSISVGLFDMQMRSTFDAGTIQERALNLSLTQNPSNPGGFSTPVYSTYTVTAPTNNSGTSRGLELAWQQPIMYGFGLAANYTYAQSSQDNPTPGIGGRQLLGAAKQTGNLTAYYQNDIGVDAHLAYTAHSQIYEGIDRANKYFEDDNGELDAHLGYKINDHFSLAFDITNITDSIEKYVTTVNNQQVPRANYDFGRTMYFTLTAKY